MNKPEFFNNETTIIDLPWDMSVGGMTRELWVRVDTYYGRIIAVHCDGMEVFKDNETLWRKLLDCELSYDKIVAKATKAIVDLIAEGDCVDHNKIRNIAMDMRIKRDLESA